MLCYLIYSASASLVSGGHIDFSALPDAAHLHEDVLGVHQTVLDNLDAPEVPHGSDPQSQPYVHTPLS